MLRHYDDFELVIQAAGERYVVQLLSSPAGEGSCDFVLPFSQVELSNFYGRIGQVRRTTRRIDTPDVEAARNFGDKLFRSVFAGELLSQLRSSIDHTREHGHGLRIRLRLKGVPELAELPWEFLYDLEQDHFLATSTATPMVRYLDLPQSIGPLRVKLPLRVLVVISGPRNLPALDAEGEWDRLKQTLGPLEAAGSLVLERLPTATLDALRRRARGEPFHIIHFIGHGGFDEAAGDGVLHFENPQGLNDPIPGKLLGNVLRDHECLRLAVLNACEGARQSNKDPFSGVAQSLCQQRMPAIVAMQFEISDAAAKTFAEEFYGAIAEGFPVDASVSEARKALFGGRYGQEWATPVLYMRSPNGLLFDVQRRAHKPEPQPPAAAPVSPQPQPPVAAPAAPQPQPAEQQRIAAPIAPSQPPPRPAPPPMPPPKPQPPMSSAKDDAERIRREQERLKQDRALFEMEKARRAAEEQRLHEEQRLREERARFERERAEEQQRRRELEARRMAEELRQKEEGLRREAEARERQRREETQRQEALRQEELRRQREAATVAAAAANAIKVHPPPPAVSQPMAFVATGAPPKPTHRVRNTILWILGIAVGIFIVLAIIGFIIEANEKSSSGSKLPAASSLVASADQAFDKGDYAKAIEDYRSALRSDDTLADAHSHLCNALAVQGENAPGQKGDYSGAVQECERAVQLTPTSAEAHNNLCNALVDKESFENGLQGNFDRAIQECREALSLRPVYPEALNNLCNAIGTRSEEPAAHPGDRNYAIEFCEKAIELKPAYAEAHKNLADLLRDSGNDALDQNNRPSASQYFQKAAAEYRRAVALKPTYVRAQSSLGGVLFKSASPDSVAELDKAIAMDPSSADAYLWRGYAYLFDRKDPEQAAGDFQKALELEPKAANGEYGLWLAYRAQGKIFEARQHLKRAYSLNPADKSIANDYHAAIFSVSDTNDAKKE